MKIKFLKATIGDSILLSFKDEEEIDRNILIDGGTGATYFDSKENISGELLIEIEKIKKLEQKIDLLVVTHIDDDHIGGILKWFSKDPDAFKIIGEVWFNSGKTIAEYLKIKENKELGIFLQSFKDAHTSIKQGIEFENYIETNKIWSKEVIKSGQSFEKFGLKIKILSPNINKLEKLLKEYKKPKHDYHTDAEENDWAISLDNFINSEKQMDFKFKEDNSIPNGSSIAFILTYNEQNYIFLGDAHPSVIIESLQQMNTKKGDPLKAELLKVSHHGSCYNTNKEVLELIETDNFIISNDGTAHNLPNKRTFARIIERNLNANIFFNYEKLIGYMITKEDRDKYPNIKWEVISEY